MDRRELLKLLTFSFADPRLLLQVGENLSALDTVRSRRLMRKIVEDLKMLYVSFMENNAYGINDALARRRLKSELDAGMGVYKEVLYDYVVVCDESNNPPLVEQTGLIAVLVRWKNNIPVEYAFDIKPVYNQGV